MQAAPSPAREIRATVHKVNFHAVDTGYTVFEAYPEGSPHPARDRFTAVGSVGSLAAKETVILRGDWFDHERFGRQFKVAEFELPDFKAGGVKGFLMSGYLKGVGDSLAKAIFDRFGEETATVFETDPQRLLEVKGIGEKKLDDIVACWREHSGKREVLAAFSHFGIGPKTIQKILKKWQNPRDALAVLDTNPYLLAWDIHGVGFLKADEIARKKGFGLKHPLRVQAAIAYALDEAAQREGHCFLYREDLFERVNALLNPDLPDRKSFSPEDVQLIEGEIFTLISKQKIIEQDGGRFYLTPVHAAESRLEQNLLRLLGALAVPLTGGKPLDEYERENGITLDAQQRTAVMDALRNSFHVITGGPGTGKTTIIKAVLACLGDGVKDVRLCAPTGRAAKRMSESTGRPAQTIHRMLGMKPGQGFEHNRDNPLGADMLIVDEASMLDVFLAKALTDALKPGARLVVLGDVDQLPSVAAGAVLKDILDCPRVSRTRLTKIFRQTENSFISVNARAVIDGRAADMNLSNKTDDFFWMGIDHHIDDRALPAVKAQFIQDLIVKAVRRLLELGHSASDIQVLSPTYKGEVGVARLNALLQDIFNKEAPREKVGFNVFSVGDRVMQLRNNYDKDVFNGDQGRIVRICRQESKLDVDFDGRVVTYEFKDADELTLAYCITVHKSQGSESPVIIQPVSTAQYVMLQRNLLYTGITRAKSKCILVGEKKALNIAIRNQNTKTRNTNLLTAH
jgi:exodeoxyribonuclease V alpha subunit